MFFTVSRLPDGRLPNHTQLGPWWFSHDNGWYKTEHGWYKGYENSYASVAWIQGTVTLSHDALRSFPLWWDQETLTLTNMLGQGQRIWADSLVDICDDELRLTKRDIVGEINTDTITVDQAVDAICENLKQKFSVVNSENRTNFKKLFVSGGIDTLTLLSVVKNLGMPCELLDYEHFEYDEFTNHNIQDIRKTHWAYGQIHHWRKPALLISGAYGDEFLFRGPHNIAIWAAWHDINLVNVLKTANGYHVGYFQKPANLTIFHDAFYHRANIKAMYPTYQDLVKHLLDTNANDHQHWHLGNTLTLTPFKDLELTKLMLRLDQQDLVDHIIDATVNKNIISKLYPAALKLLSHTKNQDSRCFLHQLHDI